MLIAVDLLHESGVVHADIKPDNWIAMCTYRINLEEQLCSCNIEIKDTHSRLSWMTSWTGFRLALIDFGKARVGRLDMSDDVDPLTKSVVYSGSCAPDQYMCPAMREKRLWKFDVSFSDFDLKGSLTFSKVDYFGVACCIFEFLFKQPLRRQITTVASEQGNRYKVTPKFKR